MKKFEINLAEKFLHLPRAPIVESVIDIRSHTTVAFEEENIRAAVSLRLIGYSYLDSPRAIQHEMKIERDKPPLQTTRDLGLMGLRFQSDDKKQIVQFNRDGFVFSRLEPYTDWESFAGEGLNIWKIFKEIMQPAEINRIGLRFINRIELPLDELQLDEYIKPAPESPRNLDLPFIGFMHHDTLAVPGYPYNVNLVRTIQPPQAESGKGAGLIIDIDVFTTSGVGLDETGITHALEEMRWLKNKAFFGSVTEKILEDFR
jgi:uncharacterized protein (TIGR04255 family)